MSDKQLKKYIFSINLNEIGAPPQHIDSFLIQDHFVTEGQEWEGVIAIDAEDNEDGTNKTNHGSSITIGSGYKESSETKKWFESKMKQGSAIFSSGSVVSEIPELAFAFIAELVVKDWDNKTFKINQLLMGYVNGTWLLGGEGMKVESPSKPFTAMLFQTGSELPDVFNDGKYIQEFYFLSGSPYYGLEPYTFVIQEQDLIIPPPPPKINLPSSISLRNDSYKNDKETKEILCYFLCKNSKRYLAKPFHSFGRNYEKGYFKFPSSVAFQALYSCGEDEKSTLSVRMQENNLTCYLKKFGSAGQFLAVSSPQPEGYIYNPLNGNYVFKVINKSQTLSGRIQWSLEGINLFETKLPLQPNMTETLDLETNVYFTVDYKEAMDTFMELDMSKVFAFSWESLIRGTVVHTIVDGESNFTLE